MLGLTLAFSMASLPIPLFPCHWPTMATSLILPHLRSKSLSRRANLPQPLLTHTVKVSLLVPGAGSEVAGLHTGLDGVPEKGRKEVGSGINESALLADEWHGLGDLGHPFLATRKRKTVWARSMLMATVHFWPPCYP